MEELQRIKSVGEDLGLSGESLILFIKEEQGHERDARQEAREVVREREAREVERERDAMAERERIRVYELEKLRLEGSKHSNEDTQGSKARTPKLPNFVDDRDNIDFYLERFERFAKVQKWNVTDWATNLSALLSGKALEVYSRLSSRDAVDYAKLKDALLRRYQFTEEGFRTRFRDGIPETGESPEQFCIRLENYLKRWVSLSKTPNTYEGMVELLLKEQFINTCGHHLSMFLREREVESLLELTSIAERYLDARNQTLADTVKQNSSVKNRSKEQANRAHAPVANHVRDYKGSKPFKGQCFKCQKFGHKSHECRSVLAVKHMASVVEQDMSRGAAYGNCTCNCRGQEVLCAYTMSNKVESIDSGEIQEAGFSSSSPNNMPVTDGLVGTHQVRTLRDSGCSSAVVGAKFVSEEQYTGRTVLCWIITGECVRVPIARIQVSTPFIEGNIEAMVFQRPLYELVIGNLVGARHHENPNPEWEIPEQVSVMTRAQTVEATRPTTALKVDDSVYASVSLEEFKKQQMTDTTLDSLRNKEPAVKCRGLSKVWYISKKGVLYRMYQNPGFNLGIAVKQLVVPGKLRAQVMQVAHESMMSGHLGVGKTLDRIQTDFFWPGIQGDVNRHCKSCDICQRTIAKGKVRKVPLSKMPIMEIPFQRVAVDLIGPLHPVSKRGNRYILTIVDYATRYPEAVPLRNIDTETVAEALLEVYSRVGIPQEVLSDMGTQFVSELMQEVCRLISVKQLTTTPYHPMCNGLCERFNGTLKSMLRKMCSERPVDWDRYLPALLFAYREVPTESLGFSPFELLYGRTVRGPMRILRELWTKDVEATEVRNTYQYVLDLKARLETTYQLAQSELAKSQSRYKKYYDRKASHRKYKVGDKVLVLLPTDKNKLTMQWKGPYEIVEEKHENDYVIEMKNKNKTFHVNMLKLYNVRESETSVVMCSNNAEHRLGIGEGQYFIEAVTPVHAIPMNVLQLVGSAIIEYENGEGIVDSEKLLECPATVVCSTHKDVNVSDSLSESRRCEVVALVEDFKNIFSETPGSTNLVKHDIHTFSDTPVRVKPYPIPYGTRDEIEKEVVKMLELGVIEESSSPYSAPVVLVAKKDNTKRFCIDYRRLNLVTRFDTEPMNRVDDILVKLSEDSYFTKIDLTKGYWQILMADEAKEKTAFVTPSGSYQFCRMPFGLMNSAATFNRMMRKLLRGIENVDSYIDDILIHTSTWNQHVEVLRQVFSRIQQAHITIKPSKCMIGYKNLEFVGHEVSEGGVQPNTGLVEKILNAKRPETKKQVRSFMGLAGYYREFIPNFAALTVPLTNLTRKGEPNIVRWSESCDNAFLTVKSHLTTRPILKVPDMSKKFVLQTDASDTGVGAVLLQSHDEQLFPVAYASKKLLDRERSYSAIERECLALVWAVGRFQCYLYGREFVLQTDHQPLIYINKCKITNGRLMRWALALQPYKFNIEAIKGVHNVGADYMSRID